MQIWIDRFLSFQRGSVYTVQWKCGSGVCLKSVSVRDFSVFSFSPDMGHCLSTTKLSCFGLKATTAFDCYRSVGSLQSVDQRALYAGFDLCHLFIMLPLRMAANVDNATRCNTGQFIVN